MLPENLEKLCLTNAHGQSIDKRHQYNTQRKKVPNLPRAKNIQYSNSVLFQGIKHYSSLSAETLNCSSLHTFVKTCKRGAIAKETWHYMNKHGKP